MQSALGSPQAAAGKLRFLKYLKGNQFNVVPAVVDLREGGDGLDFGTTYKAQEKVQGKVVAYLRPEIAGQFFQLLPGGATWYGGTLPPTSAVLFHDNHASHPYGTLQVSHPGSSLVQLFSDVRFLSFELLGQMGKPWQLSADFTAITYGASAANLTPTYYGVGANSFDDLFLWHGNPSYVLDGNADSTIESIRIAGQLGSEELQAQNVNLDDIAINSRVFDVEVVRRYQSPTQWAKIAYGAAANVSPTTAVATGALSAFVTNGLTGTQLRSMGINMGLLSYRYDNLTELDPDGQTVRETISARALHTATAAIAITLQNAHASAYAS
jgi:hypothetical protein